MPPKKSPSPMKRRGPKPKAKKDRARSVNASVPGRVARWLETEGKGSASSGSRRQLCLSYNRVHDLKDHVKPWEIA